MIDLTTPGAGCWCARCLLYERRTVATWRNRETGLLLCAECYALMKLRKDFDAKEWEPFLIRVDIPPTIAKLAQPAS